MTAFYVFAALYAAFLLGCLIMAKRKPKAPVSYDTKPEPKSDLALFLEHQEASELRYHARISDLLACMQARGDSDNERIASLIETLDKIVTAEYDQPTVVRSSEVTVTSSPIPDAALNDILEIEDDAVFVKRAAELQE